MKEQIKKIFKNEGLSEAGFVRAEIFSQLADYLPDKTVMVNGDINSRINPFIDYEWVRTFAVCLLPYFCGGKKTSLSRYVWGKDYHAVMREYLSPVCVFLNEKGFRTEILCDNHNLNERYLAYKAGLGFFGRNGFLINDTYGTYTFIGIIATDAQIEPDKPLGKHCMECGRCEKNCPGNAISAGGICGEKCVSYLTQKKDALTRDEENAVKKSGYIWGCDICQEVCPHNKYAKLTNIYSFSRDLIKELDIPEDISNRKFKRKYSDRAFVWRGKQPILRNINIKNL